MSGKQGRDGVALWRAIKEQEVEDDIAEIEAMSDEELDCHISDNGGDPKAIRARGQALAKSLLARQQAWQGEVLAKLEALRAEAAARRELPRLPRAELLARLETARKDPRFEAPVTTLFQKKALEASSDEELQSLLDAIELLAKSGQA